MENPDSSTTSIAEEIKIDTSNAEVSHAEASSEPSPEVVALVAPIASALANAVAQAAKVSATSEPAKSQPSIAPAENTSVAEKHEVAKKKANISRDSWMKRQRLRYSHTWQFPVALACILLGIMVGLQYRAQAGKGDIQIDDRRKLVELVRAMESERNKMSNELKETRAHMVELEESSGKREQISKQLQDQLVRSRIEAGLTGMKGPGVVVSMNDSPRTAPATEDNYFYIVHDVDLTALVNELWAAGAEAICVNDQRIVTRSSIRCVGPAVLVNGVRITAPYITKAIGSKDLETALRMPGGFLNSMAPLISKGGEVKMNSMQEVVIPPYEGSSSFRYGQSFEKAAETPSASSEDNSTKEGTGFLR